MNPYEQQMVILGILYHHSNGKNIKENENYGMSSDTLTKYANAFVPSRIAQINAKRNLAEMGYITISDNWIAITPKGRKELFEYEKKQNSQTYANAQAPEESFNKSTIANFFNKAGNFTLWDVFKFVVDFFFNLCNLFINFIRLFL